jgi:hypothetical protein
MDLKEIKSFIEKKLKKQFGGKILLDNMRVIDEDSRQSFAYNDSTYVWFYYWLGTLLKSESLIEIGFRLGLLSGNFLRSCKTVKNFFAVQEYQNGEYYSPRLAQGNIKDNYKNKLYVHVGDLEDDVFQANYKANSFQIAIINEEVGYDKHRYYLDFLWEQMEENGIIIVEYVKRHNPTMIAFKDFCSVKNKEFVIVNTTYGVGMLLK